LANQIRPLTKNLQTTTTNQNLPVTTKFVHLCISLTRFHKRMDNKEPPKRSKAFMLLSATRQTKSAGARRHKQLASARAALAARSASSQGGVRRLRASNSNRRGANSKRRGDDSDSEDDDSTSDDSDSCSINETSSSNLKTSSPASTRSAAASAADARGKIGISGAKCAPFPFTSLRLRENASSEARFMKLASP